APVNSVSCPVRDVTTVAPQALWFLNNRTPFRQAQEFAGRIVKECGNSDQNAWVERVWQIALGRAPTDTEKQDAVQFLEKLAGGSESKPLETAPAPLAGLPPAQAAALVKLCLTVLNLNEFAYVD